ncbi:MAG TPA: sulfotransferase [Rhizomicrobium sp.]|jgi:predicted Zn-dependent protease|nr:sulfotransferase [Rhizomicrobium sp.]
MEQARPFGETGPLWGVIAAAAHLLESDPVAVERQLHAILKVAPGQQQALQLLVDARRARGDLAPARAQLESMVAELPQLASIHYELGLLLTELGEIDGAIRALSRVLELEPKHPQAWRSLGDALAKKGDIPGAANAYAQQFASSITDLQTLEQVSALELEQAEIAESVLREYLNVFSTDLAALELLGKLHLRAGLFEAAEEVFKHALDIAPSFQNARANYISALRQQLKPDKELRQLDILLEDDPENPEYRRLKAQALSATGQLEEAIRCCEDLLRTGADQPDFWLTYAHVLRVAGRQDACIAAYRKVLERDPHRSEGWWALANLRTFRFSASDVQTMRSELTQQELSDEHRGYLHFALGKALEDFREYEPSFVQYKQGNALIRARNPYDIEVITESVAREERRFTRAFFEAHAKEGCPSGDPIFILGLPRSGSTLIEQILASHPLVEGAGELPSLTAIVRRLGSKETDENESGDDADALLKEESLKTLGEEYLQRCRTHRKTSNQHFTDKMPTNFHHLGWICAMLPNARIVDARRNPLDCCLSNFKQIFPNLRGPSYDLGDIGRYYRDYVELLAHFDRVLPGRIHRVIYEDLVRDSENEIRRLLDYCGLPFEQACLRFYETGRGIRTISSEQVRQPIYNHAIAQWRNYEPWLGPLKAALGPYWPPILPR